MGQTRYTKRYTQVETLDARAIERATVGQVITEKRSPGLRLRVGARTRTWIYRYADAQHDLHQLVLGHFPAVSITAARARWAQAREGRRQGKDPAGEERAARRAREVAALPPITVGDITRAYFAEHIERSRQPKGVADTRRLFAKRVYPVIGKKPCAAFDVPAAVAYLKLQRVESLAAARVLRAELRAAWRHALEAGRIREPNPFVDILKSQLPHLRRTRFLPDAELRAFLAWLPRSGMSPEVQDALLLTLYLALRSGEVMAARWRDIDLKNATWTLHITKTDQPRTVRLPRQALAILKARRGRVPVGETYVFPSPIEGRHMRQHALVWAILECRDTLDIAPWGAHDLRRSTRTGFARLGVPDAVAEAALGHTRGGIQGTYDLHRYEAEVGDALQKWCDHLDSLCAGSRVVKMPLRRK